MQKNKWLSPHCKKDFYRTGRSRCEHIPWRWVSAGETGGRLWLGLPAPVTPTSSFLPLWRNKSMNEYKNADMSNRLNRFCYNTASDRWLCSLCRLIPQLVLPWRSCKWIPSRGQRGSPSCRCQGCLSSPAPNRPLLSLACWVIDFPMTYPSIGGK